MIVPTSKVRRHGRGKMLFINGKRRKYAQSGKLNNSCDHLALRRAFDGTSKFRHRDPASPKKWIRFAPTKKFILSPRRKPTSVWMRRRFDLMSKPRLAARSGKASAITALPRNFLLKPCRND